MRFFIDCEFNGDMGELMSMALVSEGRQHEFYEVVVWDTDTTEWVEANVVPHLGKTPVSYEAFQRRLYNFLSQFSKELTIMADHPSDIRYLMEAMRTDSQGGWFRFPLVAMVIDERLSAANATVPHNALEDARAIEASWAQFRNGRRWSN